MVCLHCGKKLSMVKKLTTGEFCSAAHKKAYLQEQERFALARLLENQSRLGSSGVQPSGKKDIAEIRAAEQEAQAKKSSRQSRRSESAIRKAVEEDSPVSAGYLTEEVQTQAGPQYLALPPVTPNLHIDLMLPEGDSGISKDREEAPAKQGEQRIERQGEEQGEQAGLEYFVPGYAVTHRFGLDAILHTAEQSAPEERLLGLEAPLAAELSALWAPEAVPHAPIPSAPPESVQTALHSPFEYPTDPLAEPITASIDGRSEIRDDWTRVDLDEALNRLADQGAVLPLVEISLEAANPISQRPVMDSIGPKRFAFSRVPGMSQSSPTEASLSLAGAVDAKPSLSAVACDVAPKFVGVGPFEFGEKTGKTDFLKLSPVGLGRQEELKALGLKAAVAPDSPAFPPSFEPMTVFAVFGSNSNFELAFPQVCSSLRALNIAGSSKRDGMHSLWEASSTQGHRPSAAYDLSQYQTPIQVPPRITSPRKTKACLNGNGALLTMVPLDFRGSQATPPQGRLRANGEKAFERGPLLLPKQKLQVLPAQESLSVLSALGHFGGGRSDFSLDGVRKHWKMAPNDLRWIAMAIPIVIGLIWYSSSSGESVAPPQNTVGSQEQVAESTESEPGLMQKVFGDDSMLELKRSIQKRAAVELSDDFRQGLADWSGVGDWAKGWSYDRAGFLRPRQLAFYSPSLELSDYRFEFLGQIERKALSWVFRAADPKNYYVNRLEMIAEGPLPDVVLVRYAVVGGRPGPRTVTRLPMQVQMDTLYRIRVDVSGQNFVTTIQGQVVDVFSDDRISRGGVGFFANPGEDVRLRWVEVSHQYDFLGRLCAFLVPYNVSNNTMRSGQ